MILADPNTLDKRQFLKPVQDMIALYQAGTPPENSVKEVYNEQHLKNILEDEDAVKMGLKKDNIALVDAHINVQYDSTKVPNSSGENKYIGFTLIRENESKPWLIANSGQGMGGVSLIDFQNPRPTESAELYVWKNKELTGNDNAYFIV